MRPSFAPFALTILFWSFPLAAQNAPTSDSRYEIFGAYSFNTDFVPDQPVLLIQDQKVSPFFSNGSGPFGFEASVKRHIRGSLGLKAMVSAYFDPFFEGPPPTASQPFASRMCTPKTGHKRSTGCSDRNGSSGARRECPFCLRARRPGVYRIAFRNLGIGVQRAHLAISGQPSEEYLPSTLDLCR
jgi:hypothetical protein